MIIRPGIATSEVKNVSYSELLSFPDLCHDIHILLRGTKRRSAVLRHLDAAVAGHVGRRLQYDAALDVGREKTISLPGANLPI